MPGSCITSDGQELVARHPGFSIQWGNSKVCSTHFFSTSAVRAEPRCTQWTRACYSTRLLAFLLSPLSPCAAWTRKSPTPTPSSGSALGGTQTSLTIHHRHCPHVSSKTGKNPHGHDIQKDPSFSLPVYTSYLDNRD